MELRKYAKYLSRELFQLLADIEKGIGIEVTELPPKALMPTGARFIIREGEDTKEYIKLSDGEYHLLSGGSGSDSGREIELQKSVTHIQWRYVDDAEWTDLVALSEITGASNDGADGREVELRIDSGYIQWKYDTEISWTNLIALTSLKGDTGQSIDHTSFTSTTAISGFPNEPGETDTYTCWGDVAETINLGTFTVYNGADGGAGSSALDDLTDVNIAGVTDGQTIIYDSGSGTWIPHTFTASLVNIALGWILGGSIDLVTPTYPEVSTTLTAI